MPRRGREQRLAALREVHPQQLLQWLTEATDRFGLLQRVQRLRARVGYPVGGLAQVGRQPLRLVATSCFSGGFAELAFAHADVNAGPTQVPRCGLFAGTWDRKTSGCDPNPDRVGAPDGAEIAALAVARRGGPGAVRDRARAAGARVIVRQWAGYSEQKNFAGENAAHDWILSLDAEQVKKLATGQIFTDQPISVVDEVTPNVGEAFV